MPITAFYAGLLVPLFVFLSVRVIGQRRAAKVALGDGGVSALARRIRAHANFAEYVPFAVVMIGLSESLKANALLLHALGAALVMGRCLHAFGISRTPENFSFRIAGMSATFTVLIVSSLTCLVLAWRGLV